MATPSRKTEYSKAQLEEMAESVGFWWHSIDLGQGAYQAFWSLRLADPAVGVDAGRPSRFQEFKTNGEEFFRYYTELSAVSNLMRGCLMLVGYWKRDISIDGLSNDQGSYEGLDIVKYGY
jgi:hypothetical protein